MNLVRSRWMMTVLALMVAVIALNDVADGRALAMRAKWGPFKWTYAAVRTSCPNQAPCVQWQLTFNGGSIAQCQNTDFPRCLAFARAEAPLSGKLKVWAHVWGTGGSAKEEFATGDTLILDVTDTIIVSGPDKTMRVSGSQTGVHQSPYAELGQLAVVYVPGGVNSLVSHGLSTDTVFSVNDLIARGYITADRVLLWKERLDTLGGSFTFDVSVTGKPDSTLAVLIGGHRSDPIPTLSEWAMIIFSVLLLGMMTYYVVRRRRAAQVTAF